LLLSYTIAGMQHTYHQWGSIQMDLKENVVVVTGAAQGLGLCMAKTLAARGACLALVDMNQERLDEAVAELAKTGCTARGYLVNVTKEKQVVALFEDVVRDFGTIDGLINNAGITRDGMLIKADHREVRKKMSLSDWHAVIEVNQTGVFLCGREAAAHMVGLGVPGLIVNISSVSRAGNMGQTNYSAAKAAVAAMTVTWAKELARHKIRCAAIAPGFTATEMVTSINQTVLDVITSKIPMGRLAEPEEMAQAVLQLFENDYMTGCIVEVDGGLRL
jgi:3-oxoacyl-[acyl-carrier protein] reductase